MRLKGTRVLLTGNFQDISYEEARAKLEARGAILADDVGVGVEVVFAADDFGPKVDAARELGLRVKDEAALKEALTSEEPPPKPEPGADAFTSGPVDLAPPSYVLEGPPPLDAPDAPASAPRSQPSSKAPQEQKSAGERQLEKGARVKIVGGTEGVGEVGEIFWWGNSKYGEGMRAGVKTADDATYWVDEEHLGWPEEEVDEKVVEAAKQASRFGRGDAVRVISGPNSGDTGTIFWWGKSKYGDGMRAGVETDDGKKLWLDAHEMAHADGAASPKSAPSKASSPASKSSGLPRVDFDDDDIPF